MVKGTSPHSSSAASPPSKAGKLRILIVEDDYELQEFIGMALKAEGHELHFVDAGREAVRKAQELHPNLFLLDLNLPQMNGVEVFRSLDSLGLLQNSPCVFMTAMQDAGGVLHSATRALGGAQFLQKPFTSADLIDTLSEAVGRHGSAKAAEELKRGCFRLDPRFRRVWVKDKFVGYLAPKRFQVLVALVRSEGPIGREALLRDVWGDRDELNTVDKTIQRLREDLGPEGLKRIQTTPGGYQLIA